MPCFSRKEGGRLRSYESNEIARKAEELQGMLEEYVK